MRPAPNLGTPTVSFASTASRPEPEARAGFCVFCSKRRLGGLRKGKATFRLAVVVKTNGSHFSW